MTQVGKSLISCLNRHRVNRVFGYSGGAALPLLNQLYRHPKIKFIDTVHEQWAGHAAEGYSKALGRRRPGVVIATSGPGVTNLITPLQDAYNDNVPLVAITGQVGSKSVGTRAFQEVDAEKLSDPCTVWSYRLKPDDPIDEVFQEAFNDALEYQRPVLIDIPKDIALIEGQEFSKSTSNLDYITKREAYQKKHRFEKESSEAPSLTGKLSREAPSLTGKLSREAPSLTGKLSREAPSLTGKLSREASCQGNDIEGFIRLLKRAERPVLIFGQGAINPYHLEEDVALLQDLIYRLDIPHCTTLMAAGYCDETHPLNLKMLGMHGSYAANWAVHHSDLIIGIGCRFDDRITGNMEAFGQYAREAYKEGRGGVVAINNSRDIGLTIHPDLHIQIDSHQFLTSMRTYQYDQSDQIKDWKEQISSIKTENPFPIDRDLNTINIPCVLEQLDEELQRRGVKDLIVTTGVGCHQMMAYQHLTWRNPFNLLTSGSLGTMGVGVPFAIGATLACPNKPVIVIDGDGSFNMSYNELNTIRKLGLPIKIIVMNDARQQMVYMWQELFFDKRIIATENDNPDYLLLAESNGIMSLSCSRPDEIRPVLELMLDHPGAMLVDAVVRPSYCLPFVAPGKPLIEMITENPMQSSCQQLDRTEVPS